MAMKNQFKLDWLTNEVVGELQLFLAVLLLGISLVAMRQANIIGTTGPFTFTAGNLIMCTILLIITKLFIFKRIPSYQKITAHNVSESTTLLPHNNSSSPSEEEPENLEKMLLWGCLLGAAYFLSTIFQQVAMITLSAGKTGFIVGMFVVFVPIAEWAMNCFDDSLTIFSFVASLISLVGLFLFSGCAEENCFSAGAIGSGEFFALASMVGSGAVVVLTDLGIKEVDSVSLMLVAFASATVMSLILALATEADEWVYPFPALTGTADMMFIVAITQIVAMLISAFGQRFVRPTRASLLLCLESVSAAFFGWVLLHETLTGIELAGATLMLFASILSSLFATTSALLGHEDVDPLSRQQSAVVEVGGCETLCGEVEDTDSVADYDSISDRRELL